MMGIRQSRSDSGASWGLSGKTTLGSLLSKKMESSSLELGIKQTHLSVYKQEDVSNIPESVEETLSTSEGAPCTCGRCNRITTESQPNQDKRP